MAKKKRSSTPIAPLLEAGVVSKGIGSVLSRLFRKITKETGLNNIMDILIENYEKNSSKEKGQISTAVLSEEMTWKSFCDNITNLLRIPKFVLTIELHHANSKITIHSVTATANNVISGGMSISETMDKQSAEAEKTNEVKKDERTTENQSLGNKKTNVVLDERVVSDSSKVNKGQTNQAVTS